MKNSELLDAMGLIDDVFIEEAYRATLKTDAAGQKAAIPKRTRAHKHHAPLRRRIMVGSIAACLCLVAAGAAAIRILPVELQPQEERVASLSTTEEEAATEAETTTEEGTTSAPQSIYELNRILGMTPEDIPIYLKDQGFEAASGDYPPSAMSPSARGTGDDILYWWTDESAGRRYFGDPARMYLTIHPMDPRVMDPGGVDTDIEEGEFYRSTTDFTSDCPPRTVSLTIIVPPTDTAEGERENDIVDSLYPLNSSALFYETSPGVTSRYYACSIGGADGVFTTGSYVHDDGTYEIILNCYYLSDYCESQGIAVNYQAMAQQLATDSPT